MRFSRLSLPNHEDLKRVATPELLDDLITNSLAIRLGDQTLHRRCTPTSDPDRAPTRCFNKQQTPARIARTGV